MRKKILFILHKLPMEQQEQQEVLEMALGIANFEQNVGLLLLGNACWNLQATGYTAAYTALQTFGISNLYIKDPPIDLSWEANKFDIKIQQINQNEYHSLLLEYDIVLNY